MSTKQQVETNRNLQNQPNHKQCPVSNNGKPNVLISPYSECNSKFRFSAWNHRRHLNKQQDEDQKDQLDKQSQQETNTNSELSTDFFFQLKQRSQVAGLDLTSLNPMSSLVSVAGYRSRAKPAAVDLSQIKGPTGSVRGHKDVVRKSLEGIRVANSRRSGLLSTFSSCPQNNHHNSNWNSLNLSIASTVNSYNSNTKLSSLQQIDEQLCSEYLDRLAEDEQDHCVAYTTTLGIIRRTFEDSKLMKSILNLNLIKYEERDIYLNQEYKYQLRLRCNSIIVPALFVDGQHIGGAKELELMNENGDLQKVLSKFKMSAPAKEVCLCCGNAKFIACPSCNGSRRSTIHHFKYNSIALRCIKCDKNDGLVLCPVCHDWSPDSLGRKLATIESVKLAEKSATKSTLNMDKMQPAGAELSLNKGNDSKVISRCNDNNTCNGSILLDMNNNIDVNGCIAKNKSKEEEEEQIYFLAGNKDFDEKSSTPQMTQKRQVSTC